jgi:ribulose-5-phosphate 4-epimerase/fuculose-1-phosphate aldolase
LTSEEYSFDKPYPFGFLLALNQLNISSKEAIMLGDSVEKDILGANNVGITGVLLSNKKLDSKKISLIKPNFQIKSLTELENLINEINVSSSEGYTKYNCMFKHDNLTKYNNIFLKINPFREKLYDLGLIGAYKNKVGFGNISTRINNNSENYFLISGTKTGNFMKLRLKDYSLVIDYDISKNELTCKGETKASSESLTHAVTYELNSNINAVIHIHSKKMWDFYLDKVPTTSKDATYGTPEIAKEIKRLYSEDEFSKTQFAVLGGHEEGLLVYGSSLDEAYEVLMEYLCYYNQSIKKA